jgi:hypothetical protein
VRKLFVAATLAALAALLVIVPASAGVLWCAKDPIVALNGSEVQILVAVPDDLQSVVNGPIAVRVATPDGVSQELVFTDAGFNGHGEVVAFATSRGAVNADGSFNARIDVAVPADRKMLKDFGLKKGELPVLVTVVSGDVTTSVEGTNAGVTLDVLVTPAP